MNDFYKLLKQSIIDRGLDSAEARQAAYAQARRAMVNRLWSYKPPLDEHEIDHRVEQFDKAVILIEDDVAEAFATMAAEAADEAEPAGEDITPDAVMAPDEDEIAEDEDDTEADAEATPEVAVEPAPAVVAASLDERSLAVERALMEALDVAPAPARSLAPHDEDLAVWPDADTDDQEGAADADATDDPNAAFEPFLSENAAHLADTGEEPAPEPSVASDSVSGSKQNAEPAGPSFVATMRQRIADAMPRTEQAQLRALVGAVAALAVILLGGLAWILLPGGGGNGTDTPPALAEATAETTPAIDPNGPIRLPREAIAVTSGFSLFDGHDPTVFAGDPNNPVRYDGELARIASSTGSSGAKVIIGAGLSGRLAGQTVRIVLDARSARENGATSMRFAYESGVALSHWQTANLGKDFSELSLVWRVPTMRTNPQGDYIVIEPGIPGSGTGVEIRSVRIELANS